MRIALRNVVALNEIQIFDGSLLTREDLLFLFDSATARMSKERSGLRIALRNVVGCYKETLT